MKNSNIKHRPYGYGIARKVGERTIAMEIREKNTRKKFLKKRLDYYQIYVFNV